MIRGPFLLFLGFPSADGVCFNAFFAFSYTGLFLVFSPMDSFLEMTRHINLLQGVEARSQTATHELPQCFSGCKKVLQEAAL